VRGAGSVPNEATRRQVVAQPARTRRPAVLARSPFYYGLFERGQHFWSRAKCRAMSVPNAPWSYSRQTVTGLVLAGGLGRRMGGEDKGLVELAGRPMVEHVLDALRPQVGPLLINANRNLERYGGYGYPVVSDALQGYMGPLVGALSALQRLETEFLVTVPCDAPLIAPDLVGRLHEQCVTGDADVAVARDGERLQPVFLLLRASVAPALDAYLAAGGRKIDAWFGEVRVATADFSDRLDTFINVNDPDERRRVEARLLSEPGSKG
jgi:molybdenum cofactor guanylyltransferase